MTSRLQNPKAFGHLKMTSELWNSKTFVSKLHNPESIFKYLIAFGFCNPEVILKTLLILHQSILTHVVSGFDFFVH